VGPSDFSPGDIDAYISLRLDKSDTPYVAFDDAVSGKIAVMRFNGALWESVGPAGLSPGVAWTGSLVLSPTGVPYVGFQDGSPGMGSRSSVLRTSFDP
jgi:hypothetical protein